MVGISELWVLAGQRIIVVEVQRKSADLAFLSLQLCLASNSRHVSRCRSDVIRFRTLGSLLGRRQEASRQWEGRADCREGKIMGSIGMNDEYIDK